MAGNHALILEGVIPNYMRETFTVHLTVEFLTLQGEVRFVHGARIPPWLFQTTPRFIITQLSLPQFVYFTPPFDNQQQQALYVHLIYYSVMVYSPETSTILYLGVNYGPGRSMFILFAYTPPTAAMVIVMGYQQDHFLNDVELFLVMAVITSGNFNIRDFTQAFQLAPAGAIILYRVEREEDQDARETVQTDAG